MTNAHLKDPKPKRKDWRLRAAIRAGRVSRSFELLPYKVQKLIQLITNNFALGILRRDGIDDLVEFSYAEDQDYYNPNSYNYQWEQSIVEPLHEHSVSKDLLVAFCGKGREAKIFAKAGFTVTGIDREAFMIEGAIENVKANNFEASFECADFNTYTSDQPFSVVYTSTWMFTTYPGKEARRQFLEKCKELRSEDGLIVISYRLRNNRKSDKIGYYIAKFFSLVTRGNQDLSIGDQIENLLFWKYFTENEIDTEIAEAGLCSCYHHSIENGRIQWKFLVASN
ncbi:MAG: class I SAM-dependent methyltransferase [Verrucomicrobiota bacterium]